MTRTARELVTFCAVGASGYVVNLAVFAAGYCIGGLHHLEAALVAFSVAVVNNFLLNRRFTFGDARAATKRSQAPRFLVVSVLVFVLGSVLLDLLVTRLGAPALLAQATAIGVMTPVAFASHKLLTFRVPTSTPAMPRVPAWGAAPRRRAVAAAQARSMSSGR